VADLERAGRLGDHLSLVSVEMGTEGEGKAARIVQRARVVYEMTDGASSVAKAVAWAEKTGFVREGDIPQLTITRGAYDVKIDFPEPKRGVAIEVTSKGFSRAPERRCGLPWPVASPSTSASAGTPPGSGVVANANAVVHRMKTRFRNCFVAGLATHPKLGGTITVIAKVGPTGAVTSVSGGKTSSLAPIVPCLHAVVASGKFDPPKGGNAVISIPITFVAP
jgi:hypothetical protein